MDKLVYLFEEGDRSMNAILGGKGANLAEMSNAGLPVPPGFTITTEACMAYYANDKLFPDGMWLASKEALKVIEAKAGKIYGDPENPLLLSVRSGAPVSMPGMMDTVLNLGLTSETVQGLAVLTNDERFAWDAYRRFVQAFGEIVLGVPKERLHHVLEQAMQRTQSGRDSDLSVEQLQTVVTRYQEIIFGESRQNVPDDAEEQLRMAIAAVFDSWMTRRAVDYRRINRLPDDVGTAVNVQAMVFGNVSANSGTGVAFTRHPSTGEPTFFGEFLDNAQGEDVVAGIRTPMPIAKLADMNADVFQQLQQVGNQLERHYRDMQDIEFTIEDGRLYMLQTRTGKRTGRSAIRIAVDMVNEGLISREEALQRVSPQQLEQLLHPIIDPAVETVTLAQGLPASPGAASGRVVFDADEAEELAAKGDEIVLVRQETNPDDFHGLVAANAVITARGGMTSHAAVVARGMGKCCVVGASDIEIDYGKQLFSTPAGSVSRGDWVTVDGNTGQILMGQINTIDPDLDENFKKLMDWADEFRTMRVRANADNPTDAQQAREFGAEGIGLCRTEHMFFEADRIEAMRQMIMAPNAVARAEALAKLEPLQTGDFVELFRVMEGYPVTIRLLDPPLHEFLPRHEETVLQITNLKLKLRDATDLEAIDSLMQQINEKTHILEQIERLEESNPMLGHRGCRLGIMYPEITEMQARAIFTAAVQCHGEGIDVHPEVMVPLVSFSSEFNAQEALVRRVAEEVFAEHGVRIDFLLGTMIELPRAALTADQIAESAEFFSFGTNDLTQTTMGLSRDDSARFLPGYVNQGVLQDDPFQTIDKDGVGQLVRIGTERGRLTRPDLKVGICGEHGGDPESIDFCYQAGLNYVSCSAFRVPVARLAAAQASIKADAN
ncbi:MAG: pyruvate, phosphate dikinase [Candidatus Promineifilaceae bacterium]|nr:pyruvate, phosphate dikinase [Candidatus Promineifilaceae bacterium]